LYATLCAISLASISIPNASANLAFLLAIRQSLVHFGAV
jgi:hypothetical protein